MKQAVGATPPAIDADALRATLRAIAGPITLSQSAIATRLARTAARCLEPDALAALDVAAPHLHTSPEMLRWSVSECLRQLSGPALVALAEAELGALEPFHTPTADAARPVSRMAVAPSVVTQVIAGTVPPLAVEAIVLPLLCKSGTLVRTSRRDPYTARWFLHYLAEVAPELARHVAVASWADDEACDRLACSVPVVNVFGADDALAHYAALCRFPTRFFGFGHHVGVAVVASSTRGGDLAALARAVAFDVAAHEQRGCMSPHTLFVERGGAYSPERLARAIAEDGLMATHARFPRQRPDPRLAAAAAQIRGVAALTGEVFESDGGAVVLHDDTVFRASPGGRLLHVVPYDALEDLVRALEAVPGVVGTAGLECAPADETEHIRALARIGARRVCHLGRMQRPLLIRDHDGRPRLADWVEWVNAEPRVR